MKTKFFKILFSLMLLLSLSSCSIVEGIFKVGMVAGIFVVIAILAIVVFIITRFTNRK